MMIASSPFNIRPFALLAAIVISLICHLCILSLLQKTSNVSSAPVPKITTIRLVDGNEKIVQPIQNPPYPLRVPFGYHKGELNPEHVFVIASAAKQSRIQKLDGHVTNVPRHDEKQESLIGTADQIHTPATPKKAYKVPIDYPDFAADLNLEGSVIVLMEVTSEGKVQKASIKKKLGFGLDEFVLSKVQKFEFEAALNFQGQPVNSIFEHEVRFELD